MQVNRTNIFTSANSKQIIRTRIDKYGREYRQTIIKQYHSDGKTAQKIINLIEYVKQGALKQITSTFSRKGIILERIEMGGGKCSNYKDLKKFDEKGYLISHKESSCDIGNDFN